MSIKDVYLIQDFDGMHVVWKSGGDKYYGVFDGVCECAGWQYRGTCKHVDMAYDTVKGEKISREDAEKIVELVSQDFRSIPQVSKILPVGQLRTQLTEVDRIDLIVSGDMDIDRPTIQIGQFDGVLTRVVFTRDEDFYDVQKKEMDKLIDRSV